MTHKLRRDIRLLKIWGVASACLLVTLGGTLFSQGQARVRGTRFDEISTERLNIVEPDGRVRLVLANSARQADAVVDGRVLSPGGNRPAGLIFFNEVGDEVGGLLISGRSQDGRARAATNLTFDQWQQDQTVVLQYFDQNGQRKAGLSVIDRPSTSIAALAEMTERRRAATTDAARAAVDREIAAVGPQNMPRVFVGRDNDGSAALALSDPQGKQRLLLSVDANGRPSVRFLDASGKTIREIVP